MEFSSTNCIPYKGNYDRGPSQKPQNLEAKTKN